MTQIKCSFRKTVKFIGHVASKVGLCVEKVKAVVEMPIPKDVVGVQHLLDSI